MWNRSKSCAPPASVSLLALLATLLSSTVGATARAAADTMSVKDTAHLQLLKASNSTLTEAGKATGTLPGSVQVMLKITGRTASSSFRITADGGSIWGHGAGELKLGKGGYESFGGSLAVDGGSGRFAHAHGSGGLYGTLNRLNDAMTVQVSGDLRT